MANIDRDYIDMGTLRINKISRNTFGLSGTVLFHKNLGDDVKAEIIVLHGPNKGHVYASPKESICKFTAEEKKVYPDLVEASNLPQPGTCPIPKNNYTVNNYIVRKEHLPKIVPAGTYYIEIVFSLLDSPIAGYSVEAIVT